MGVFDFANRRTVRGPINPMDKSTIVTIYPRAFKAIKPTVSPGIFYVPAGTPDNPDVLVVGSSSWWKEIDAEQPLLEIPNSSVQVADAIVKDFCNGLIGCNMTDSVPGLFWVPGDFTVKQIKEKHFAKIIEYKQKQINYYMALIKMADGLWARTNGNPLVISDDMRLAAKQMNLEAKDWMQNFTMMENVRCSACGSPRNPNYPVCPNCKAVIDHKKANELGLKFAV